MFKKKSHFIKGGLTVLISVLVIYGIAQAGSLTPPASPAPTSYTLSDIYTRLTTNETATEADHIFSPAASPAGTLYTLTQIYNAIPTIVANTVKLGTSYLGVNGTLTPDGGTAAVADLFNGKTAHLTNDWILDTGTLDLACNTATFDGIENLVADAYDGAGTGLNRWCMTDSGDAVAGNILSGKIAWVDGQAITGTMPTQTLSADNDTVAAGYYNATTLSAVDADLVAGNIRYGTTVFGFTGTLSPYPNTPSGISGLNQTVCSNAGWTWVADSNYDGINDDPICVNPDRETGTRRWNMSGTAPYNVADNTFIGNYGCSGDPDGDGVGTLNTTLSGTVVENDGYGDDVNVPLAIADCKDGIRNLLTKAAVEAAGYTVPDNTCTPTPEDCHNGPLTPKALIEWKGTRLPSYNDFFGVCGNGTDSTTFGDYGNQIGRPNNVITANAGSWEWLSEPHFYTGARVAGSNACSVFNNYLVTGTYGFRVVFRP